MRVALIAACVLATVLAAMSRGQRGNAAAPAVAQTPTNSPTPYGVGVNTRFAHMSAASCSASACHGGGRVGEIGSEHSTWAQDLAADSDGDPHSRAYRVLFNEVSLRMTKLLGSQTPAHENKACLACHAPAGVHDPAARAEGVGCTACHGPSEKWLGEHYLPEWKAKTGHEKWADGFVPTKNLVARISNCASCHVGGPGRDMNHDMIAAGHPRLAFEYTQFHYHKGYRKHWRERAPQPDFEVRAWVVGQAASLRAAVALLQSRAARAEANKAPWPEFAGTSCFACHKKVGEKDPTTPRAKDRRLGVPGWEAWYNAALSHAVTRSRELFPGMAPPQLAKLAELKAHMSQPIPSSKATRVKAAGALMELDAWIAQMQLAEEKYPLVAKAGDEAKRIAGALAAEAAHAANRDWDWDSLAVYYLGCAAMYHANGGAASNPAWEQPLRAIRKELLFPTFSGGRFNGPAGFDDLKAGRVRTGFGNLSDAMRAGENR